MEIRAYRPEVAPALARIHNGANPTQVMDSQGFRQYMASVIVSGGRIWVMTTAGIPVAYGWVQPLPGLPDSWDLYLCVDRRHQRRGLGSQLLEQLIGELRKSEVQQVSYGVSSLDTPGAYFLQKHGFVVEHREVYLELPNLDGLPPFSLPEGYHLQTFPQAAAIGQFLRLYDDSFRDLPWYQPYGNEEEVAAELADPADILFLLHESVPIGFVWAHWPAIDAAEIEPLGITAAYQGRGLARALLVAGLHQLAEQGAVRVTIGAWDHNEAALHLYETLGFSPTHTFTYLALNLGDRYRPLGP